MSIQTLIDAGILNSIESLLGRGGSPLDARNLVRSIIGDDGSRAEGSTTIGNLIVRARRNIDRAGRIEQGTLNSRFQPDTVRGIVVVPTVDGMGEMRIPMTVPFERGDTAQSLCDKMQMAIEESLTAGISLSGAGAGDPDYAKARCILLSARM